MKGSIKKFMNMLFQIIEKAYTAKLDLPKNVE